MANHKTNPDPLLTPPQQTVTNPQGKMVVQGNQTELTAQEQEAERKRQGLTQTQNQPHQPTRSQEDQKLGSEKAKSKIDPSKISVEAFIGEAVTDPDPNALFQEKLKDLQSPYATALELRRRGFHVEYTKGQENE